MTATAARPRIVVLDSFAIDQGEPETTWRELAELGELVVHPQTEPAEVGAHARDAIAVLTNKVALSAADLQALPQVRYVGVTATGTNVVDRGRRARRRASRSRTFPDTRRTRSPSWCSG